MTAVGLWWLTLGMGLITLLLRASFIVLQERIRLPTMIRRALVYVPAAVLAAMVAPAFIDVTESFDPTISIPRYVAGLMAALIAVRTQSIIAVLAVGMATLWGVQALMR